MEKAFELGATELETFVLLADIKLYTGALKRADQLLNSAAQIYPRAPEALFRLAETLFLLGDYQQGKEYSYRLLNNKVAGCQLTRFVKWSAEYNQFARASFESVYKQMPGVTVAFASLAFSYYLSQDFDKLNHLLDEAAKVEQFNPQSGIQSQTQLNLA